MSDSQPIAAGCYFTVIVPKGRAYLKVHETYGKDPRRMLTSGLDSDDVPPHFLCAPRIIDFMNMWRVFKRAFDEAFGATPDIKFYRFEANEFQLLIDNSRLTIALYRRGSSSGTTRFTASLWQHGPHLSRDVVQIEQYLLETFKKRKSVKGFFTVPLDENNRPPVPAVLLYTTPSSHPVHAYLMRAVGYVWGVFEGKRAKRRRLLEAEFKKTFPPDLEAEFKKSFPPEDLDCFAQRVCDAKSCDGNEKWNHDPISKEKMDLNKCVVLNGKKCVEAASLSKFWRTSPQHHLKDPFTMAKVDPCERDP